MEINKLLCVDRLQPHYKAAMLVVKTIKKFTQNLPHPISHVLNEQGTGYEHIFSSVQTFIIN